MSYPYNETSDGAMEAIGKMICIAIVSIIFMAGCGVGFVARDLIR